MTDRQRSRTARDAAEAALVRVMYHYDGTPEFVLLGGLVPELLCTSSSAVHAGTSDVDVQVDLEIAQGAVKVARLERALLNAEFTADSDLCWRWKSVTEAGIAEVKFELLADLPDEQPQSTVSFDACEALGAVNLPGTGYAARDYAPLPISAKIGGNWLTVEVNVTRPAGFLLAKTAAARGRRQQRDWYDIAYVLLHNDIGAPRQIAELVLEKFGPIPGDMRSMLVDLGANFADAKSQGVRAYTDQMLIDHPGEDAAQLEGDAELAVRMFLKRLDIPV